MRGKRLLCTLSALLILMCGGVAAEPEQNKIRVPASSHYIVSIDLKRAASVPAFQALKGPILPDEKTEAVLLAAGCSRFLAVGGAKWSGVLVRIACPQQKFIALLKNAGVAVLPEQGPAGTFYRFQLEKEDVPEQFKNEIRKSVMTFVAPDLAVFAEEKRLPGMLDALKTSRTIPAEDALLWCVVDPQEFRSSGGRRVDEVLRMFRQCKKMMLKVDLVGSQKQDLSLELGADCKDPNSANFAAFMLPAAMTLGLNFLCSADVEFCNHIAGMIEPGVSGSRAYARLLLDPENTRRAGNAMSKTLQYWVKEELTKRK